MAATVATWTTWFPPIILVLVTKQQKQWFKCLESSFGNLWIHKNSQHSDILNSRWRPKWPGEFHISINKSRAIILLSWDITTVYEFLQIHYRKCSVFQIGDGCQDSHKIAIRERSLLNVRGGGGISQCAICGKHTPPDNHFLKFWPHP